MRKIVAVVVFAFLLRLAVLAVSPAEGVLIGDGRNYLNIVENLAAGRGMIVDTLGIGSWRALYPPVYPVALWLFSSVFGLSTATVAAFNFACDLGTAAGIITLARLTNAERAGYWAAGAYLLWPTSIILSPVAAKEPLIACEVVWLLYLLLQRRAAAFGALWGVLALTQPALAPLPAVALLFTKRLDLAKLAVPVAALLMLPWWVRNYLVLGAFVPLTTGSGVGLWMAAVPWGNGGYTQLPPHLLSGGELAITKAAQAEGLRYIADDPAGYLWRCVEKVARVFSGDPWAIKSLRLRDARLELLAAPVVALPPLLFAGGAAAALLNRSHMVTRLLVASVASLLVFQFWFEMGERHRYFLTPVLLLTVLVGRYSTTSKENQERAASTVIDVSLST